MKLQDIYKWVTATIALIPGFTIILTSLGTPPGISEYLYGGIVEACGCFTLLLLFVNRKKIGESSSRTINRVTFFLILLFFCTLLFYIIIFNTQVIYNNRYDTKLFFPFWHGADLQFMVEKAGSKYNSIENYGPQAVIDAVNNSQPYTEISRAIFTILYVVIFECLIIGFGILGIKIKGSSKV